MNPCDKGHTPPLKLGHWTRIIGRFTLLPENHPVTQRLIAAGMGITIALGDRGRGE